MFARTFRNFCFKKNLLRESLVSTRRQLCDHGRDRRDGNGNGNFSKFVPKLVYLHNPLTFLWTQFQLARLSLLWDREFLKNEFFRGIRQSATVLTNCIREQDQMSIRNFTTIAGYHQITRDMLLSRDDARLQLVRFRSEDFHRTIPFKVVFFKRGTNKNCFIDVLLVGMRNLNDFPNTDECQLVRKTLRQLENEGKIRQKDENSHDQILFSEIHMRFSRDYTPKVPKDWSVSFYKIISFDVWNFK